MDNLNKNMSITENKERVANFTSSNIYKLIKLGSRPMTDDEMAVYKKENPKGRKKNIDAGFSEIGLTYIDDKRIEKRLGRSVEIESYSRAMAWGSFMEMYVFSKIGMEYLITSNDTDLHPIIKDWSGSKDLIVEGIKISDIKCYEPKNFAKYTDAMMTQDISVVRENFPKEYWQLVSNSIINSVNNAEAITFCPYRSELDEIREMAMNYEGADMWKYRFIYESEDSGLPWIPDDGYYKNLNKFEFEIPAEDKEFLTERVKLAIELRDK